MKRIILLLCSVVVICCASIAAVQLTDDINPQDVTTTPVSRIGAPWWAERHQGILQAVKQGNVDLLMIGDSITHKWPERAHDNWNETFSKWNVVNLGFSGDRTEHLIWRLQNGEVDGISPKVGVLMIGTNNTGNGITPAGETLKGIKTVLFELRSRLPRTKILLLAIFPRGENPNDFMRIRNNEINRQLPDLADDKNIFFYEYK